MCESITERKFWTFDRIIAVVAAVGTVFTALGVFVAYLQISATQEWQKDNFTLLMLRDYHDEVKDDVDVLLKHFPGLRNPQKYGVLGVTEAKVLWSLERSDGIFDNLDDEQLFELRRHAVAYFNHLEFVCAAYESDVLNKRTVKELFGNLFTKNYGFYAEFIKAATSDPKEGAWAPFTRVVQTWKRGET